MNQLYHGDNLAILREMPDASVDLICTDPPFNTGKDWGAFNDKWEGGLKGYLKFMEPRCVEMRRVLKNTGSLYLHCDPTASHYLKVMLDSVFGIKQFRNEIVWCYDTGNTTSKSYRRLHDAILFYTKTSDYVFSIPMVPRVCQNQILTDNRKKSPSWWIDLKPYRHVKHVERTSYPTQKPVALYARIIKASSNQHDTILDPFAGSGTTLDAAQSLGRQWIGIDQSEEAISVIQKRLEERHGMLLEYELIQHETSLTDNG